MPKSRPAYPPEYRTRILELVRTGRTPEEPAREFEPRAQTIRNWINRDQVDVGDRPGLTSQEKSELSRLRPLRHPHRRRAGGVLLHRGLLQPLAPTLGQRSPQPRRI